MEDPREPFRRRLGQLKTERAPYFSHWQDISDYISPRTSRFLVSDRQRQGNVRNSKIFDNTGTLALRTLASGMHSGITSPARPWLQLRTGIQELDESQTVKVWLEQARSRLLEICLKSNLYTVLPQVYADLGGYGTSAFALLEDDEDVIRAYGFPVGSYFLGSSARGAIDTCYREYQMTVGQLVEKFGEENLSTSTLHLFKNGSLDKWIDVVHAVEPNVDWDESKLESKHKRFKSVYYEVGGDFGKFLSQKGFDEFPIMAPRWQTIGEDIYGISPGMEALSDVKMLQVEQKRKLQAIDKMVTPPMVAPVALKNKRASLLSGDVTYIDSVAGGQKFEAAYQVNLSLQELMLDIQETQKRVRDTFFADLFMMLNYDQRSGVTAYERQQQVEEKLMALGPVYLKLNDELLDPMVSRIFAIMMRRDEIPPPPQELQGVQLHIEYLSVMAQSMKAVGVQSMERLLAFAGNMGQAFPSVLDMINADESITSYAEMIGAPPRSINDKGVVKQVREQRAQRDEAAQAMQMANSGADTAQKLANAPLGDNNALSQLMARMQGVA